MLVHVGGGRVGGGVKGRAEMWQEGEGEQVRQGKCMQPRRGTIIPATPPFFFFFKVQHEALSAIYAREKAAGFFPAAQRRGGGQQQKHTLRAHEWCHGEGEASSYLVRESVSGAGWWWACLSAPLGRNKVNSSHFQSLRGSPSKTMR